MENYVKEEVVDRKGDEDKVKHKKSLVKPKRTNAYYIREHLIPRVSSLKNLKDMLDAFSNLYEEYQQGHDVGCI